MICPAVLLAMQLQHRAPPSSPTEEVSGLGAMQHLPCAEQIRIRALEPLWREFVVASFGTPPIVPHIEQHAAAGPGIASLRGGGMLGAFQLSPAPDRSTTSTAGDADEPEQHFTTVAGIGKAQPQTERAQHAIETDTNRAVEEGM